MIIQSLKISYVHSVTLLLWENLDFSERMLVQCIGKTSELILLHLLKYCKAWRCTENHCGMKTHPIFLLLENVSCSEITG